MEEEVQELPKKKKESKKEYQHDFASLSEAMDQAQHLSRSNRSERYVIESGDRFFVSTTNNLQRYEILHGYFKNGLPQTP